MGRNILNRIFEPNLLYKSLINRLFENRPKETELNHLFQRSDDDCGQTCLEMLGYDYREDFFQAMSDRDMESISEIEHASEGNKTTFRQEFYYEPHILSCNHPLWTDQHWVLAYQDKVYCPSLGTFYISQYLNRVFIKNGFKAKLNLD